MRRIKFLFGVHNHQPVGNFDGVFRKAFEECYKPFIEALRKHPKIRLAYHCSGPLIEWIEANEKWYFDVLGEMVEAGQVEIMGGGFYEPILSIIPEKDALGQIEMMSDWVEERFGVRPRGAWLAERIWEPQLASTLSEGGMDYTVIDESHFSYSGLRAEDMFGYYMTEDNGALLRVFPIDKTLRYSIPFKMPEETLEYLRTISTEDGTKGVTIADDGEKFGVWPGTHKWVYTDGYLEKLFTALEENSDWIEIVTFSEYIDEFPPMGRIYLPTASYEEMMEWALPASSQVGYERFIKRLKSENIFDENKPFVRGGFWRNFMAKYAESNLMHKKMLYVSSKIHNGRKNPDALKELWRGQCNCAYWHGLFGGLYLNYLRHAVYSHLISAENIEEKDKIKKGKLLRLDVKDHDMDGVDEVLVSTGDLNCYISPGYGGAMFELDYRPKEFNLTNVLKRREEGYHRKIREAQLQKDEESEQPKSAHNIVAVKEDHLEEYVVYDRYNRYSFIDHFFAAGTTIDRFSKCQYEEVGDFAGQLYKLVKKSKGKDRIEVKVARDGCVRKEDRWIPVRIEKVYTVFPKSRIEIDYTILNKGVENVDVWFGTEMNFTLLSGYDEQRYYEVPEKEIDDRRLASKGVTEDAEGISLIDRWSGIHLSVAVDRESKLWRFPVETVSQSESGFERNYQGSCLVFSWKFRLMKGQKERFRFDLWVNVEE